MKRVQGQVITGRFVEAMPTSAFKSSSKRGTAAAETRPPSTLRRRSHSVSAVSRKTHAPIEDKTFDFSNSRDNPLFWSTSSPPPDRDVTATGKDKQSYSSNSRNSITGNSNGNSSRVQRGRPVTRSSTEKNGIGSRSLSRGRSVSEASYEHEKEHDTFASTIAQRRNEIRKIDNGKHKTIPVRNRVDRRGHAMNEKSMKIQSQGIEWSEDDSTCSMQISNLEDGLSIGSLSEAEDKNVTSTSNNLNAFLRSNVINTSTDTHVADMPSTFINPEAVELISEVRREYAMQLEESEERTRKLRADLAIEEHRGKELDRILKEMLPVPKTCSSLHRSRHGRRISNERKRMSKCLTEDAMAYFDECVSLSTFDSSDFSASEDPTYSSAGATTLPVVASSSLVKGSPSTLCSNDQGNNDLHQKQLYGTEDSSMTANSSSAEPGSTLHYNFTFTNKKKFGHVGREVEDIRSYIKNFEKAPNKDSDSKNVPSAYYDAGEYMAQFNGESMLVDRVLYNSRIESGSLHLCGNANSLPSFCTFV